MPVVSRWWWGRLPDSFCKGVYDQHQGICWSRDGCTAPRFLSMKWALFCHGGLASLLFRPLPDGGYLSNQDKSVLRKLVGELIERLQRNIRLQNQSTACWKHTGTDTKGLLFWPPKASHVFSWRVTTRAHMRVGNGNDNTRAQAQLSIKPTLGDETRWGFLCLSSIWMQLETNSKAATLKGPPKTTLLFFLPCPGSRDHETGFLPPTYLEYISKQPAAQD